MDLAQRYVGYSLEDLRDVERRINRAKFPEAYAVLIAEIEKREAGATQGLESPSRPEPLWHATVRKVYNAVFAVTITFSMICALIFGLAVPVAHAFVVSHSSPAATATQTAPLTTGQGRDHRTVYVTPREKARLEWLARLATTGLSTVMPIVLVVGLTAQGLGIRIFDSRKSGVS